MSKYKDILYILIFLFIMLITIGGLELLEYNYYNVNDSIGIDAEDIKSNYGNMEYKIKDTTLPSKIKYTFNISKEKLNEVKGDTKVLLINKLAVEAYKVYFNGIMVEEIGDFKYGKSKVHNNTEFINIDEQLIKDNNIIEINTYSNISTGLYGSIKFMSDIQAQKICDYETLKKIIITILIISSVILSLLLIILSIFIVSKKDQNLGRIYIYLSGVVFFISLYSTEIVNDHLFFYSYFTNYKLKLIMLHIAIVLLGFAVKDIIIKSYRNIFPIFMLGLLIVYSLLNKSFISYKEYVTYLNISIVLSIAIYIYLLIKHYKPNYLRIAKTLCITIIVIELSLLRTFKSALKINYIFVYYIDIIAIGTLIFFVIYNLWKEIKEISKSEELEAKKRAIKERNIYRNIGEAFFSVDTNLVVKEQYTKVCNEIFGESIAGSNIGKLIGKDSGEEELINNALISTLDRKINPLVCAELLPESISKNNSIYKIKYNFIGDNNDIEEIIVIMSDITEIIDLQAELESEKRKSSLIISAIVDRENLIELINEFIEFTTLFDNDKELKAEEIVNKIHTFKGNFSMYNLLNIVPLLHNLEDDLLNNKILDGSIGINLRETLYKDLEMITELTGSSFFEDELYLKVNRNNLENVYKEIKRYFYDKEASLIIEIMKHMFYKSIEDVLLFYARKSISLAKEKDILIKPIAISGDEVFIDINKYKGVCRSFVHIFNNCIDHGLETEEERMQIGKPPYGEILCMVEDYGNFFEIIISDDGRGMDLDKIKNKALEEGIISEKEFENIDEEDILNLIFKPRFSTKVTADKLSGRGVGMATVKKEVESIGGTVRVVSYPDFGTKVKILLPKSNTTLIKYFSAPILLDMFIESCKIYVKSNNIIDLPFSIQGKFTKFNMKDMTVILPFNGPEEGAFVMACNNNLLIELSKNMLETEEISEETYKNVGGEVLKEVCNIVAGNAISLFDIEGNIVDILTPSIVETDNSIIVKDLNSWCINYDGYELCLGIIKH